MGIQKGKKRKWHAGRTLVEGRKKVTVHLTEDLYAFAKQHGNASWYLRRLIEADRERKTKSEAGKHVSLWSCDLHTI